MHLTINLYWVKFSSCLWRRDRERNRRILKSSNSFSNAIKKIEYFNLSIDKSAVSINFAFSIESFSCSKDITLCFCHMHHIENNTERKIKHSRRFDLVRSNPMWCHRVSSDRVYHHIHTYRFVRRVQLSTTAHIEITIHTHTLAGEQHTYLRVAVRSEKAYRRAYNFSCC